MFVLFCFKTIALGSGSEDGVLLNGDTQAFDRCQWLKLLRTFEEGRTELLEKGRILFSKKGKKEGK